MLILTTTDNTSYLWGKRSNGNGVLVVTMPTALLRQWELVDGIWARRKGNCGLPNEDNEDALH